MLPTLNMQIDTHFPPPLSQGAAPEDPLPPNEAAGTPQVASSYHSPPWGTDSLREYYAGLPNSPETVSLPSSSEGAILVLRKVSRIDEWTL